MPNKNSYLPSNQEGLLATFVSPFDNSYIRLCSPFEASLCNTASYVDIVAKTDTYVGALSSQALERLLEKRPIVLLTLAKRLISLLSPLSAFPLAPHWICF